MTTRFWSFWCAFQHVQANSFRPMSCVNRLRPPTLRLMDQWPSKTGYWQGAKFGHFYPNTRVRITLSSLTVTHISQLYRLGNCTSVLCGWICTFSGVLLSYTSLTMIVFAFKKYRLSEVFLWRKWVLHWQYKGKYGVYSLCWVISYITSLVLLIPHK